MADIEVPGRAVGADPAQRVPPGRSDVRARLDPARPASLLTLVEAVHPTATVSGTDGRDRAHRRDRDSTAAATPAVGYVDADGGRGG
ncbi:hypothetical protein HBB16_06080 [Pseudonocardia sp. MCCB 268]|nr:hypothetical protein [Pseudonocardia cytotoxica]